MGFVIAAVVVAAIAVVVAGGSAVTLPGNRGRHCARLAVQRTGMCEKEQGDDEQSAEPATRLFGFVPDEDHLWIIGSTGFRVKVTHNVPRPDIVRHPLVRQWLRLWVREPLNLVTTSVRSRRKPQRRQPTRGLRDEQLSPTTYVNVLVWAENERFRSGNRCTIRRQGHGATVRPCQDSSLYWPHPPWRELARERELSGTGAATPARRRPLRGSASWS